jgi:hypothetical protein
MARIISRKNHKEAEGRKTNNGRKGRPAIRRPRATAKSTCGPEKAQAAKAETQAATDSADGGSPDYGPAGKRGIDVLHDHADLQLKRQGRAFVKAVMDEALKGKTGAAKVILQIANLKAPATSSARSNGGLVKHLDRMAEEPDFDNPAESNHEVSPLKGLVKPGEAA